MSSAALCQQTRVNIAWHRFLSNADADIDLARHLEAQGVDYLTVLNVAGPIIASTGSFAEHVFQYELYGDALAVIAVHDLDAATVVDLVGWKIQAPDQFATFFGHAGLLGADAIVNPASFRPGPCPVWATPLRWLQAMCAGAAILSPELARPTFANAPAGLFAVDSLDEARELIAFGCLEPDRLLVRQADRRAA